jgi:3'-phosphoadenosine 5'-phosphosulfate sulfotransferase (PAPS reductase)/FAD synthetase
MSWSDFVAHGPTYVSFSGGETSALMLRRTLDANDALDGHLPPDLHVLFANTGKECEATLDFVHEVETRWHVPIVWVERAHGGGYREVTWSTASREGEPFAALIAERGFVPNMNAPYCSTELKARVMRDWMLAHGYEDWTTFVGLRVDEPRRVARARGRKVEGGVVDHPLFDANLTKDDVQSFWEAQPFRLGLRPWEGNCDLCFKKAGTKKRRIIEDTPGLAAWWSAKERETGSKFRNDRADYATMADVVRRQVRLPMIDNDTEGEPCVVCTE